MQRFKKILVGVDLTRGDRLVTDELAAPTLEAIDRGLWLAKTNSAELLLFSALDISPHTQRLIEEDPPSEHTVLDDARDVLATLIAEASGRGVRAESQVEFGKPWVQVIRRVVSHGHDLVVVGTRELGKIQQILFGCTAIKLVRVCPCPVWVTKPPGEGQNKSILVANDLTEVGHLAMELGCSMAALHDAQLHVLHAVTPPDEHHVFPGRTPSTDVAKLCADAEKEIAARLDADGLTLPPRVHVVIGNPDTAILEHLDRFDIELLIMGSLSRMGIAGILVGNTAERLLPEIKCSLLAVKPADFKSPIQA